jgi:hypothetical protein
MSSSGTQGDGQDDLFDVGGRGLFPESGDEAETVPSTVHLETIAEGDGACEGAQGVASAGAPRTAGGGEDAPGAAGHAARIGDAAQRPSLLETPGGRRTLDSFLEFLAYRPTEGEEPEASGDATTGTGGASRPPQEPSALGETLLSDAASRWAMQGGGGSYPRSRGWFDMRTPPGVVAPTARTAYAAPGPALISPPTPPPVESAREYSREEPPARSRFSFSRSSASGMEPPTQPTRMEPPAQMQTQAPAGTDPLARTVTATSAGTAAPGGNASTARGDFDADLLAQVLDRFLRLSGGAPGEPAVVSTGSTAPSAPPTDLGGAGLQPLGTGMDPAVEAYLNEVVRQALKLQPGSGAGTGGATASQGATTRVSPAYATSRPRQRPKAVREAFLFPGEPCRVPRWPRRASLQLDRRTRVLGSRALGLLCRLQCRWCPPERLT